MLKQSNSLSHRRPEILSLNEDLISLKEGSKSTSSIISRPWNTSSSSSSSKLLLRYMQKLLFLLIGMAIASCFFLIRNGFQASQIDHHGIVSRRLSIHGSETSNYLSYARYVKVSPSLRKMPLRILVTGGAGFVGSHLVDHLINLGHNVIVLDNFFTGRKSNVKHHIGNPHFDLIRHDVIEPILLEVDQIYHLACPASPVHYKYNPIKTIISLWNGLRGGYNES